jgi:hypothetical protein
LPDRAQQEASRRSLSGEESARMDQGSISRSRANLNLKLIPHSSDYKYKEYLWNTPILKSSTTS